MLVRIAKIVSNFPKAKSSMGNQPTRAGGCTRDIQMLPPTSTSSSLTTALEKKHFKQRSRASLQCTKKTVFAIDLALLSFMISTHGAAKVSSNFVDTLQEYQQ